LETAFCHGDYHPLNVIWEPAAIGAIIDWEFCGYKPALDDLANLLGCVGVEQPEALEGPVVRSLLAALGAGDYLSEASWTALPAYVLALRFAWLSEWLRRNDQEMIALELDYMNLLLKAHGALGGTWRRMAHSARL
jgi:homoserine kinase type II